MAKDRKPEGSAASTDDSDSTGSEPSRRRSSESPLRLSDVQGPPPTAIVEEEEEEESAPSAAPGEGPAETDTELLKSSPVLTITALPAVESESFDDIQLSASRSAESPN
jgi:hypothetical protein